MADLRDKIARALNIEGAFCGTCDREPGDSLYCKACVRVLNGYADAVLTVLDLDKVRAEAWDAGHESAAMRVPEGVWHDVATPHPGNPYRNAEQ